MPTMPPLPDRPLWTNTGAAPTTAAQGSILMGQMHDSVAHLAGVPTSSLLVAVRGAATAGSCTYIQREARFVEFGKLVHFSVNLQWSGHTGTGQLQVSDLLVAPSAAYSYQCLTIGYQDVSTGALTALLLASGQVSIYKDAGVFMCPAAGQMVLGGVYER